MVAGLATLIWSINYIFAKHVLREFPPMLASGLRTAIAALLMAPVYVWHMTRRDRPSFTRRDLFIVTTLGILGGGLNQVLFVLGISRTTVAHAAVIVGLTPVLVLALATLLGHENLKRMQLGGMLVALAGVAMLQLSSRDGSETSLSGDLLVFCGCFMFAFLAVFGKRETTRLGPVVFSAWGYLATAITLLPVILSYSRTFSYGRVSWYAWASLFYMAAFSSVIGYLLFYYALAHIPASRLSTFAYLQPVIATCLAMIFLGERPTPSLFSGGALVLAGVYVAERS
jgi:drug/metabolite transporter (DMT)-like permease